MLALRAAFLVVRARARLRISVDDVAAAAFRLRWDEPPNTLDAALRTANLAPQTYVAYPGTAAAAIRSRSRYELEDNTINHVYSSSPPLPPQPPIGSKPRTHKHDTDRNQRSAQQQLRFEEEAVCIPLADKDTIAGASDGRDTGYDRPLERRRKKKSSRKGAVDFLTDIWR